MQPERYILGIDGGGTRTTALLATARGVFCGEATGKSINYNSVGMQTARENMADILHSLKAKTGITLYNAVCVGSSALFFDPPEEEYRQFTQGLFTADHVFMAGDIQIALESMLHPPCVLAISGTGSMAAAWGEDGGIRYVGGWGYLLGDEGSAYCIAMEGIKAAILAFDGLGPETKLQNAVLAFFDIPDMRRLVEVFYNPVIPRSRVSAFAQEVSACADSGDGVAQEVIKNNAAKLAHSAAVLLEGFKNKSDVPVAVSGGVFQNNRLFFDSFKERIAGRFPGTVVQPLIYPPQVGALLYCLKHTGRAVTPDFLENIRGSYLSKPEGEKYG